MADMLRDIVEFLAFEGAVQGEGIDAFCDHQPDDPDQVVILQEYAGPGTSTGVEGLDRNVQVIARTTAEDPEWAKNKIWQIFNLLDTPEDRVFDTREIYAHGTRWGVIYSHQTPFKMGIDPVGRTKYVFNFGITTYRD